MRIFNTGRPPLPRPPVPLFQSLGSSSRASETSRQQHLDDALNRTPTGRSIAEPGSVFWPENGRTYHGYKEGKYFFPNDAVSLDVSSFCLCSPLSGFFSPSRNIDPFTELSKAEQDRLDFQHACFLIMTGGVLALAPISSPRNVLDIGTGTGIWAIEFGSYIPLPCSHQNERNSLYPQS
jgi:hypothetical protein